MIYVIEGDLGSLLFSTFLLQVYIKIAQAKMMC